MMNTPITFDQLIASINDAHRNPVDTCWQIYHYLKANYKESGSVQSRMLMTTYMKICPKQAGRLHSCILQVAGLMCQEFGDFKFDAFLQYWGYPNMLMPEDMQRQTSADGKKSFLSLRERTDRLLLSYMLHHTEARTDTNRQMLDAHEPSTIMSLLAVKVFETERNGRKMRSVKMISHQGKEFLVDNHLLPCKPWEIHGRLFDATIRLSKEGVARVQEAVVSSHAIADVFPPVAGYVDRYDANHRHYHIYDSLSRHFVAENPKVSIKEGDMVLFSPVVPMVDKFKVAVVHSLCQPESGMQAFGLLPAEVTYINKEKDYFRYKLSGEIPTTPEGAITEEGFGNLSLLAPLSLGDAPALPFKVSLLLFLKRGKDGKKHNYVARIV